MERNRAKSKRGRPDNCGKILYMDGPVAEEVSLPMAGSLRTVGPFS